MNKKDLCVICKCKFDNEIIDDKVVCKDYTCWVQPTCKEKFTENYQCNFCNKYYNVNLNVCHMYFDEDYDRLYKYICNTCHENILGKSNITCKWNTIYDENDVKYLQKLQEEKCAQNEKEIYKDF